MSGRRDDKSNSTPNVSGTDDVGFAATKMAVAQICESVGFQGFRESALEGLTDIVIRYVRELGKASSSYANLAGRTECNVFDVIRGLDDLAISGGPDAVASSSVTIKEIGDYIETAEEIPPGQAIPRFPVTLARKSMQSFLQRGESPEGKHVPRWLPAFPDPHTYIQTPVWNSRTSDPRSDKIEQAKQRRKAERSLLNLQQRLSRHRAADNGSTTPPTDIQQPSTSRSNPFLNAPLHAGDKEVPQISRVALPSRLADQEENENEQRGCSILEVFVPAIEAIKDGMPEPAAEDSGVAEKRPSVNFKFSSRKKVYLEEDDDNTKHFSCHKMLCDGRNDEKDDKKRRAELILRQSMENPQELTQL